MVISVSLCVSTAFASQTAPIEYDQAAKPGTSSGQSEQAVNEVDTLKSNAQLRVDTQDDVQHPASIIVFSAGQSPRILSMEDVVSVNGLLYEIDYENGTAAFLCWDGAAPSGKLVIPNFVNVDKTSYAVTSIEAACILGEGQSVNDHLPYLDNLDEAATNLSIYQAVASGLTAPQVTSIVLPTNMELVDPAALAAYPNLSQFLVSSKSTNFISTEELLLDYSGTSIVAVAPGAQGTVRLPHTIERIPVGAFANAKGITALDYQQLDPEVNGSYVSVKGILYSGDYTELVCAPAGIGQSVVIDERCQSIAEGAFFGCDTLTTITLLGNQIDNIATGSFEYGATKTFLDNIVEFFTGTTDVTVAAFSANTVGTATVQFATSLDDANMSVWREAGFKNLVAAASSIISTDVSLNDNDESDATDEATTDPAIADDAIDEEAPEPVEEEVFAGFKYTLLEDYTLSATWNGPFPEGAVTIPSSAVFNGKTYTVSEIASNAFICAEGITSVSIPDTITVIGNNAFNGVKSLRYVTIGDSVEWIGAGAFAGTKLTQVILPATVSGIGEGAFEGCNGLTIVALGDVAIAQNAIGQSSGVSIYTPYKEDGAYAWTLGLPILANSIFPYKLNALADSVTIDSAQTPYALFDSNQADIMGASVVHSYDETLLTLDAESNTFTPIENGETFIVATMSVNLPTPQLIGGTFVTSVDVATAMVHVSIEVPEFNPLAVEEINETLEEAVEEVVELDPSDINSLDAGFDERKLVGEAAVLRDYYHERVSYEAALSDDSGELINQNALSRYTLPTGKNLNKAIKNGAYPGDGYAYDDAAPRVTQIYIGSEDSFGDLFPGVTGTTIDLEKSGGIKIYSRKISTSSYFIGILTTGTMVFNADSSYAFSYLTGLTTAASIMYTEEDLAAGVIDATKITNFNYGFYGVSKVTGLDLSWMYPGSPDIEDPNYVPSTEASVNYMFNECSKLTSLKIRGMFAKTVTGFTEYAPLINTVTLENCRFKKIAYAFEGCQSRLVTMNIINTTIDEATSVFSSYRFTTVNIENLKIDTGKWMFESCTALTSLTIDGLSFTAAAPVMQGMFSSCNLSVRCDLDRIDSSKVTSMNDAFNTTKLTSFNFDALRYDAKPTMRNMFQGCTALKTINSESVMLNTADTIGMFAGCTALGTDTANPVIHLVGNKDVSMQCGDMFENCNGIKKVKLENFTLNLSNQDPMFDNCRNIEELILENVYTEYLNKACLGYGGSYSPRKIILNNVESKNISNAFADFDATTTFEFNNVICDEVNNLFNDCQNLTSVKFNNVTIRGIAATNGSRSAVAGFTSMFSSCRKLQYVDFDGVYPYGLTNLSSMFSGCSALLDITFKDFDTSKVTKMTRMFEECTGLTSMDMSKIDCSAEPDMSYMFYGCTKLETLDLSNLRAKTTEKMLNDCTALYDVKLDNMYSGSMKNMFGSTNRAMGSIVEGKVGTVSMVGASSPNMTYMFEGCPGPVILTMDGATSLNNGSGSMNNMLEGSGVQELSMVGAKADSMSQLGFSSKKLVKLNMDNASSPNMQEMFKECSGLNELSITGVTSNKMTRAFENTGITTLKLSDMAIDGPTDFMFTTCRQLTSVEMDTVSSTSMNSMFEYCTALVTINATNVYSPTMMQMFYQGTSLKSIDFSGTGTTDPVDMREIFLDIGAIDSAIFTNLNIKCSNDYRSGMFAGCDGAKLLRFENVVSSTPRSLVSFYNGQWDNNCLHDGIGTIEFEDFVGINSNMMFTEYHSKVDSISFIRSKLDGCAELFRDSPNISSIKLSQMDLTGVTSFSSAFQDCTNLTDLVLEEMDTSNVSNFSSMFRGCKSMTKFNLREIDTSSATNMGYMFYECKAWDSPSDLVYFNTSNVTNMENMFALCTSLSFLDMSSFNPKSLTKVSWMFDLCGKLETITVGKLWDENFKSTNKNTIMFNGNDVLVGQNGTAYKTAGVGQGEYARVDTPGALGYFTMMFRATLPGTEFNAAVKNVPVQGAHDVIENIVTDIYFGTSNDYEEEIEGLTGEPVDSTGSGAAMLYRSRNGKSVYVICDDELRLNADSSYMFANLRALENIHFGSVATGTVKDMSYMFSNCISLQELNLESIDTSSVTNMSGMFNYCRDLTTIYAAGLWNTGKVTNFTNIFKGANDLVGGNGTTMVDDEDHHSTGNYAKLDLEADPGLLTQSRCRLAKGTTINPMLLTYRVEYFYTGLKKDPRFAEVARRNTGVPVDEAGEGKILLYRTDEDMDAREKGNVIYILSDYGIEANPDSSYMFYNCRWISKYDFNNFHTDEVLNMSYMFSADSGTYVNKIDLSSFRTPKVLSMASMFENARDLNTLNVTSFDTSSVRDMSCMFKNVNSMRTLDLTSFTGESVESTREMFSASYIKGYGYYSDFVEIKFGNFGGPNNRDMYRMFFWCYYLKSLDLSSFDTRSVGNMSEMFYQCDALGSLNVSNFAGSSLVTTKNMFYNCYSLKTIDFGLMRTPYLEDTSYMFKNCENLSSIKFPRLDTSNVTRMEHMFDLGSNTALKELNLASFDTSNVIDMSYMFNNCYSLKTVYATGAYITDRTANSEHMFRSCDSLIGGYNTAVEVMNVRDKTYACVDTATQRGYFTAAIFTLTDGPTINKTIKGTDDPNVVDTKVKSIIIGYKNDYIDYLDGLEAKPVDDILIGTIEVFNSADGETVYILSHSDIWTGADASYMFYNFSALEEIVFDNFSTGNALNMAHMFGGCRALPDLDLAYFATGAVSNMEGMFQGCNELNTVYVGAKWNTNNVPSGDTTMFAGCQKIVGGVGTVWSASHTDKEYARIDTRTVHGYFNEMAYKLAPGPIVNGFMKRTDVKKSYTYERQDGDVNKIIFGHTQDYTKEIAKANSYPVDENYEGTINLYRVDDSSTVYILSDAGINTGKDASYLFYKMRYLSKITFDNFATRGTTDMSYMFYLDDSIRTLDLGCFTTNKVTDFSYMFYRCDYLRDLNIKSFRTLEAIDMSHMFERCESLKALDVSRFGTPRCENMAYMFAWVDAIKELDLSAFVTNRVTDFTYMFWGMYSVRTIYANDAFTTVNFLGPDENPSRNLMFDSNDYLKGELGTEYERKHRDLEYARVDDYYRPGYFTFKAYTLLPGDEINAVFKDSISHASTDETIRKITFGYIRDHQEVTDWEDRFPVDIAETGSMMMYRNKQKTVVPTPDGDITYTDTEIYVLADTTLIAHSDASFMFYDMRGLTEIVFENWSTRYTKDMNNMFAYDDLLMAPDMTTFTTDRTESTFNMFYGCKSMVELDLSEFHTQNMKDTRNMFRYCDNLTTVYAGAFWDLYTVKDEDSAGMFVGCNNIVGGYGTVFDPAYTNKYRAVVDKLGTRGYLTMVKYKLAKGKYVNTFMKGTYWSDINDKLTTIIFGYSEDYRNEIARLEPIPVDVKYLGTINLYVSRDGKTAYILSTCGIEANEDSSYLFYGCSTLEDIVFDNLYTNKVTDMSHMFDSCYEVENFDLRYLDTSSAENMNYMFANCSMLERQNVSNFDTSNVTTMSNMFKGCSSLGSIDLASWDTSSLTDVSSMFQNCMSLWTIDLTQLNLQNVTTTTKMFHSCSSLSNVYSKGASTEALEDMSYMFYKCTNLTKLDLSSFDTHNVTNMAYTWYGCTYLKTILASGAKWSNENVVNGDMTFYNCKKIVGGNGTTYAVNKTTSAMAVIDRISQEGYLTEGSATLIPGPNFNSEVGKLAGSVTSVTSMVFGYQDDYMSIVESDTGVAVDEGGYGLIKIYFRSGTLYVIADYDICTNVDASSMFAGMSNLVAISFENFFTDSTKDFSNMFSGCSRLNNLDITGFYTKIGTTFENMFSGCSSLRELDLENFETINATNMAGMFNGCSSLTELELVQFETADVTNMSEMFRGCSSLKTIWANSGWTAANVTESSNMFTGCNNVVGGNGTRFNPAKIDKEYAVFDRPNRPGYLTMYAVTLLPGKEFNTELKGASYTTQDYNITEVVFGYLDEYSTAVIGRNWTPVDEGLKGNIRLFKPGNGKAYVLSSSAISANDDASYLLSSLRMLKSVSFNNLETSITTDMNHMFSNCFRLAVLDLTTFDTSSVTDFSYMFQNMYLSTTAGLRTLEIGTFDVSNGIDFSYMFAGCKGLTTLDITHFDTSEAVSMEGMFSDLEVTTLNVSNLDTSKVERFASMFSGCTKLLDLDVSTFNTSEAFDMRSMFRDCSSLTSLDVHTFDTSMVSSMSYLFSGCSSLTELNVLNIETALVTDLSYLFNNCSSLEMIDLSTFDTKRVSNMSYMFYNCNKVVTIYGGRLWSNEAVRQSTNMFTNCLSVVGECGTTYDVRHVDALYGVIDTPAKPGYLTLKGYLLVPGDELATTIKNSSATAADSSVSKIIFAYRSDYKDIAKTDGVPVDLDKLGYVKLHRATEGGKTVIYVLSDCEIRANPNSNNSFNNLRSLTDIIFENYNAKYANQMQDYFKGCTSLRELDLAQYDFNTVNLTNVSGFFEGCTSLRELDLSTFDTNMVRNSSNMFNGDGALVTVRAGGGWDVTKATNTSNMFVGCNNIVGSMGTRFNSSKIDGEYARVDRGTTKPGYLTMIFYTLLEGTDFNDAVKGTSFVDENTTIQHVIFGHQADYPEVTRGNSTWVPVDIERKGNIRAYTYGDTLYVLSLCGIETPANEAMMFYNMTAMKDVEYINFRSDNLTTVARMFAGCSSLESYDLSKLNLQNVVNAAGMFAGATSLMSVNFTGTNATKLEDVSTMFQNCSSLISASLNGLNCSTVTTMESMFSGCSGLTGVSLAAVDTSHVTTFSRMFEECTSLPSINLGSINTSAAQDLSYMLSGCSALTSLNLTDFNTSKATTLEGVFSGCSGLKAIDLAGFNMGTASNLSYMFSNCTGLTTIDMSGVDTSHAYTMAYMFNGCTSLTSLNLNRMDVSNVRDMAGMFNSLLSLETLNLTGFETENVEDSSYMFAYCENLTRIYASRLWSNVNMKKSTGMFTGCLNVVGGAGFTYNPAKITSKYAVLDTITTPGYLTLITYMLDIGNNVNSAIKSAISGVTKIVFGTIADHTADIAGCSTTNVDFNHSGDIKLYYRSGSSTVYILAEFGMNMNPESNNMFAGLTSLKDVEFDALDTSSATNMASMFSGCTSLEKLDLSCYQTYFVKKMDNMFSGCSNLKTIHISRTWTASAALNEEEGGSSANMFNGCNSLVGGHGSTLESLRRFEMSDDENGTGTFSYVLDATYAIADNKYGAAGLSGYLTGSTVAARFYNDGPDRPVLQTGVIAKGSAAEYVGDDPKSTFTPPVGEEYKFMGWNPALGAIDTYSEYVAQYDLGAGDLFTITLDAGGGTQSVDKIYYWLNAGYVKTSTPQISDIIAPGSEIISTLPTWIGHEFAGYGPDDNSAYITRSGKVSRYAPEITSDVTWKAIWDQIPLAGTVTIDNMSPRYTDILTATVTGAQPEAELYFQWCRNGEPIEGACGTLAEDGNLYSPLAGDIDNVLTCVVTDANGYYGGEISSAETDEVRKGMWDKVVVLTLTSNRTDEDGNFVFGIGDRMMFKYENAPHDGTNIISSLRWCTMEATGPEPILGEIFGWHVITTDDFGHSMELRAQLQNTVYEINVQTDNDAVILSTDGDIVSNIVEIGPGVFDAIVSYSTLSPVFGEPITATATTELPSADPSIFQWYRFVDNDYVAIDGATGPTYTPVKEDVGHILRVGVRDASPHYEGEVFGADTDPVAKAKIDTLTATLEGDCIIGSTTLHVVTDGVPAGLDTFKYTWYRSGSVIPGATGEYYSPTYKDYGCEIYAEVVAESETHTSNVARTNELLCEKGILAGTVTIDPAVPGVMQVATANIDDLSEGAIPSYQWFRVVDGQVEDITGATDETYRVKYKDIGLVIGCRVADTAGYYDGTIEGTTDTNVPVPNNDITVSLSNPEYLIGQYIRATVTSGVAAGADLAYIWEMADTPDATEWTVIEGAGKDLTQSLTDAALLTNPMYGKYLRVTVLSDGHMGRAITTEAVTSNYLIGDIRMDFDLPKVEGKPVYGATATVVTTGMQPDVVPVYTWYRDSDVIEDVTGSTYTLTADDIGCMITVVLEDASGRREGTLSVTEGPVSKAPWNDLTVTLSGLNDDGNPAVDQTVTAVVDGRPDPDDGKYTYTWFVDGVAVEGVTGSTYTPKHGDFNKSLGVEVKMTDNSCYLDATASTSEDDTFTISQGKIKGTITIDGEPVSGNTLSVTIDSISDGAEPHYQWYYKDPSDPDAAPVPIEGATESDYTLTDAEIDKIVYVEITDDSGVYTGSVKSEELGPVGKEITITWAAADGEFSDGSTTMTTTVIYYKDAVFTADDLPETPKKTNHAFTAWTFLDADGVETELSIGEEELVPATPIPMVDTTYTATYVMTLDVDLPVKIMLFIRSNGTSSTDTGKIVSHVPASLEVKAVKAKPVMDGFKALFGDDAKAEEFGFWMRPDTHTEAHNFNIDSKDSTITDPGLKGFNIDANGTKTLVYGLTSPDGTIVDVSNPNVGHTFAHISYTIGYPDTGTATS